MKNVSAIIDKLPAADDVTDAYDVGYAKPPVETRFRKGQSGNPKGRPKGSRTVKSLLELALSAPITIVEGGQQKVIEQRAALFKALSRKQSRAMPGRQLWLSN